MKEYVNPHLKFYLQFFFRKIRLLGLHKVNFNWLKGHDGHEYNERCDALAVAERDKYSRQ